MRPPASPDFPPVLPPEEWEFSPKSEMGTFFSRFPLSVVAIIRAGFSSQVLEVQILLPAGGVFR